MRYFLLAGEASGDNLGGLLITEIQRLDPSAEFAFWGGDVMASAARLSPKQHIRALAFMGFVEVLANLRTILKLMSQAKRDVAAFAPDVLVCIDYPGFNLRLARWAKTQGIWVDFFVSPQIWAWRPSRVHGIMRAVDRVLCILPFEPDFYKTYGYEVAYVGHPLPRRVDQHPRPDALVLAPSREVLPKGVKVLALLPGSRTQEVRALLPLMLEAASTFVKTANETAANTAERHKSQAEIDSAAANHSEQTNFESATTTPSKPSSASPSNPGSWRIVIAAAPTLSDAELATWIERYPGLSYVRSAYDLLSIADLACVASGSATLETALFAVPQVVCYRGNALSVALARRLVQVKYIALPNLILDQALVPELIQADLTAPRLTAELRSLQSGPARERVVEAYQLLRHKLQPYEAATKAAELIVTRASDVAKAAH